jgi:hypothetical protein
MAKVRAFSTTTAERGWPQLQRLAPVPARPVLSESAALVTGKYALPFEAILPIIRLTRRSNSMNPHAMNA